MNWRIGKNTLSIELRNGTGIDIEFVDSRAVWTVNENDPFSLQAMPFSGTIILLPLLVISFGYVYRVEEIDNE
jgi:hypothetical protein|tara:strand:+ start:443 stop:661 length:219 start_codon:yes stop_codon:yes gene_type:complete